MDIDYLTVKCVGFLSYCDALIAKKMPNGEFITYLISLVGSPSHILALSAQLFKNESCKVSQGEDGEVQKLRMVTGTTRTIRNRKIGGVVNKIMASPRFFTGPLTDAAIVYGPSLSVVQERAFLCLDTRTNVPLKRQWQDWLWDELMRPEILHSFGSDEMREAYKISLPADETVQAKVLEAIRMGYLK